jgi:glyoxylase-like metal-dependent hydrolase (beta-lactamase superfamily II)
MKYLLMFSLSLVLYAQTPAPPYVQEGKTIKVTQHVWVIPDGRVNLVPNIGIITGSKATLVVDSGMGPRNGQVTLREVRKISPDAPLFLTTTHFHPEHVSGFQVFPAGALLIRPSVQQEELVADSAPLVAMFSKWSPAHAELLKDVKMRLPDLTFHDSVELNLGGITAQIFTAGPAHTRGDSFVFVKEDSVLFGGDVITNRFFPIIDRTAGNWIKVLDRVAMLKPAMVVPGHGEIADAELIRRERAFLALMQSRTQELKSQGQSAEQTAAALSQELKAKYPNWDNPEFLDAGIRRFYAEASSGQTQPRH